MKFPAAILSALGSLLLGAVVHAGEWPHIMGPKVNRKSDETIPTAWSTKAPKRVWEIPAHGGFSSFVTGAGRAYTVDQIDGRETAVAVDRKTGKLLWQTPLGTTGYRNGGEKGAPGNEGGDGPRATPVFADNRVFVFGGRFDLHALEAATGRVIWQRDLLKEFGGQEIVWSNAASPLVIRDRVIVAGGGDDQSCLAFRASDGVVLWKAGSDRATHSTPVVATIHGKEQAIFLVVRGLVARDLADGGELWHYPFPHRTSTAASPVVWNDIVNCAAAYGVGGAACQVTRNGDAWDVTELWRSPGDSTGNHWATPIVVDGYLYGHYGHRDFEKNPLKCLDIRTGKIRWEKPGFGTGQVVLAGKTLIATTDFGDLVAIDPSPQSYRELGRAKVIQGKVWASPALSDGQILLRSTKQGVCLEF